MVRWDKTGLVRLYRTGRDGAHELLAWGTRRRLAAGWAALPEGVRRGGAHGGLAGLWEEFAAAYDACPALRSPCEQRR